MEPCLVEELHGLEVSDFACGFDHSLGHCCRQRRPIELWGAIYIQLGRAKPDMRILPVDINFHPISMASGLGHSLAICQEPSFNVTGGTKSIVSWGWNQSSPLGRTGPVNIPSLVEGLEGDGVSISGGRVHSIALTSKGEIGTWGFVKIGRPGLGSSSDEAQRMLVDCLEGCQILQAVSGFLS